MSGGQGNEASCNGSCSDLNFGKDGCCIRSPATNCYNNEDYCSCDQECYAQGNCCHDIATTGCYPEGVTKCNYDSDIRLVGGSNDNEGRVEVCSNGFWGTVCDDLWGPPDAAVVCRQLEIDGISIARTRAYFGAGTGPINMDNVRCTGNEDTLVNCTYSSTHDCGHSEDAGVTCGVTPQCNNSDIRLVDGSNDNEGRVEVCFNEYWGTVCDDYFWTTYDAAVVCKQLGINGVSVPRSTTYFGPGTGPVNIGYVSCTGNENSLFQCDVIYDLTCKHSYDVGVTCGLPPICNNTDIRLVGGSNDNEGRVEVCFNEKWSTVCDDDWDSDDAAVVCRQLGIDGVAIARTDAYFGAGRGPINMDNVQCTGNEGLLVNCTYRPNHNCFHFEDAGVTCGATSQCNNSDICLVGGSNDNEGRVEVCSNGTWGTICGNSWDSDDAIVVCRQLGLGSTGIHRIGYFGPGSGSIVMANVQCNGTEDLLFNCLHYTTHQCSHSQDAGVSCSATSGCTSGSIRLVGGSNANEGRVE
uniref:SRCR domain-containing protein n=1 Tax=Amphimedon queenslandica TaxID=400682 RepID=A0A1X7TEQ0_AMPQE